MNDRQNELLRKKQLLAQIRAEKKAADEAPPPLPPAAQAPERDVSIDLDGLLSSLPPSTAAPAVPEAVPESSAPAPRPQSASPSEPAPRPQIAQVENTTQTKEIIAYARETQTDFTSSDSEESMESSSEACCEAPAPLPQKEGYTRETQTDFVSSDSEESTVESSGGDPFKEGQIKLALEQELFDKKWASGRMVMDICYAPSRPEWIAVSYAVVPFTKRPEHPGVVEVWNIHSRKGVPKFTIFCPSPVLTVQFSLDTSSCVIGGCYNGQLVVWDLKTTKGSPDYKTNPSNRAHTSPICSVKVTGTNNMMTLTSIDKASRLCMWTLKTLKQLFHSSVLSRNECFADLHVTVLTEVPNETNAFIVGCAHGTVGKIICETEENTKIETIAAHNSRVTAIDVHPAPLNVYRGENVCNLALSASLDYTVMLTDMKKKLTLAVFEGHNEFVMDVKWHPTKPSVFASLDANGLVYLWDITANLDYPMYELRLPNAAKKILWSHDGKRLIAGDSEGVVRVYNAHEDVWKAKKSDWMLVDETAQLMANRSVYNATIEELPDLEDEDSVSDVFDAQ